VTSDGKDTSRVIDVHLPLDAIHRQLLIQHGVIDDDLRQALRDEATRRGESNTNLPPEMLAPPGGSGQRFYQLNPELMKRYGLSAATVPNVATPAPIQQPASNTAASTQTQVNPGFTMSPELMRRYGLIPAPTPTNPPPAPA